MKKLFVTLIILIIAVLISTVLLFVNSSTGEDPLKGNNTTDISQSASQNDDEKSSNSEITSESEKPKIDKSDWKLILVNPWNEIPDDFNVELTKLKNRQAVDRRAYNDLQAMMDDARAQGFSPLICSSYRTTETQQYLYDNDVKEYLAKGYSQKDAEIEAGKWVAIPGTSEHQTGLALDIVDSNYQILEEEQENRPVQKWLMENSYKYGFILRYPKDKSDITGINYEPWHYRYVGKKAAKQIYKKGICLEEYLSQ